LCVLVAGLGLSACGRKGGLDAPPSASAREQAAVAVEQPEEQAGFLERKGSARSLPVIKGPTKRIPLDALLD
jgi:predicted small lipoprotein YifL